MTSIRIQAAVADDLQPIVSIYNASIPGRLATADLEPVTVADRVAWFERHHAARPLWVARAEGEVVGWLSFESFYGRAAYERTAEISVYVAPGRQRLGIGHRLLSTAVERGPELGLSVLLGFIFGHNTPSLALFEGLRFTRAGTLGQVAELDGVLCDLVILWRRVS
jgi:phosphinothricin acetyltransferase